MAIDWAKPIETFGGKPARYAPEEVGLPSYPMVVHVQGNRFTYTIDGNFNIDSGPIGNNSLDLRNVPEPAPSETPLIYSEDFRFSVRIRGVELKDLSLSEARQIAKRLNEVADALEGKP